VDAKDENDGRVLWLPSLWIKYKQWLILVITRLFFRWLSLVRVQVAGARGEGSAGGGGARAESC
jgi:hypothetical protein